MGIFKEPAWGGYHEEITKRFHRISAIKHGDFIVISPVVSSWCHFRILGMLPVKIGKEAMQNYQSANQLNKSGPRSLINHSRCALKITYNISNMVSEEGVHYGYHHLTLKQTSHSGIFPRKHDKSRNETRMLARQGTWNLCVVHPVDSPNWWDMKKNMYNYSVWWCLYAWRGFMFNFITL